jgi:hypothetical protein
MTETKKLANYTLDIVDVTEFRPYLDENEHFFTTNAMNAYLKALDIPPKFFKEQPLETQKELLDNREIFVRETKKFFNKVIVVVKYVTEVNDRIDVQILGAVRLDRTEADKKYNQLKDIDQITNKFEHRSFVKDGYITLVVNNDIQKKGDNYVLTVDFPINLSKKPIIHKTIYKLPDETFATPIEHLQYVTSDEIELGVDYNTIKEAIDDRIDFVEDIENHVGAVPEQILRETELVTLALQELNYIPKSYKDKVEAYIEDNLRGELTTDKLESLVLDFDETFRSYKQVTNLRSVSGFAVKRFLDSPQFQELEKELDEDVELAAV